MLRIVARLLAASLAWLALAVPAPAADEPAPVPLNTAERTLPAAAPQPVRLPDELALAPGAAAPVAAHYRLQADLGAAPHGLAIYLPGLLAHARISVNRHVLEDTLDHALQPLPRSIDRIRLLRLPDAFLQPGLNLIEIEAAGARYLSVSPVWVGTVRAVQALHEERVLGAVIGPALVATTIVCLALCVLVLWARRRGEVLYGYFGGGALCWGLHSAWSVLPTPLLAGVHLTVWWTAMYSFFVMLLVVFCVRFAGWRWPRFERSLWLLALAAPAVLYAASGAGRLAAAADAWRLGSIGVVAVGLAAVSVHAWQRRNIGSVLLLAAGAVSLGLGVHDWLVARAGDDNNPVYLTPYAGLLFIMLVAWMLIDGFVQATRELEAVNAQLEARVERKSLELRSALDAMREAKEAAEAANRAKSTFLAAASHDLRQPIHALGLYLGSIPTQHLAAPVRDTLQRMDGSLSALGSMFDALLDISRMDAGAVVPQAAPFALEPLLRRLGDEFAPIAERQGLRLAVRAGCAPPGLCAQADALLVERILRNLLANALKYTREGGVLLSWRWRAAGAAPPRWLVEVWDTGCGIAASEQQRVFDEFYQVGNPERDRSAGLGLGLAIVRRLADLMALPLALCSRPGRGTRFGLLLPATHLQPALAEAAPALPRLGGCRVAVVEDDTEVRDGMRSLLAYWRCELLAGADADELLAQWRALGRPAVDAIVADLRLREGGSGLAAIERLRAALDAPRLPALVVTGESAPGRIAHLTASGVPWLAKPVDAARLRSWLAVALQGRLLAEDAAA